jgi:epoxide hydrolase 4
MIATTAGRVSVLRWSIDEGRATLKMGGDVNLINDRLRHATFSTNGIRLHVVESGPEDGPPVILLHGFPEFWYGWRHQIGPLADAGFRVLAPDQRGYAASEKPEPVSAYALDTLANDVAGLIGSTGRPRAAVVGHDWGGIVAWWLAVRRPEQVERLAVLNAPTRSPSDATCGHRRISC